VYKNKLKKRNLAFSLKSSIDTVGPINIYGASKSKPVFVASTFDFEWLILKPLAKLKPFTYQRII
jgi:hypothetical protein